MFVRDGRFFSHDDPAIQLPHEQRRSRWSRMKWPPGWGWGSWIHGCGCCATSSSSSSRVSSSSGSPVPTVLVSCCANPIPQTLTGTITSACTTLSGLQVTLKYTSTSAFTAFGRCFATNTWEGTVDPGCMVMEDGSAAGALQVQMKCNATIGAGDALNCVNAWSASIAIPGPTKTGSQRCYVTKNCLCNGTGTCSPFSMTFAVAGSWAGNVTTFCQCCGCPGGAASCGGSNNPGLIVTE